MPRIASPPMYSVPLPHKNFALRRAGETSSRDQLRQIADVQAIAGKGSRCCSAVGGRVLGGVAGAVRGPRAHAGVAGRPQPLAAPGSVRPGSGNASTSGDEALGVDEDVLRVELEIGRQALEL
jgi:hypothetical protein